MRPDSSLSGDQPRKPPLVSKAAILILPVGLLISGILLGTTGYEPEPHSNQPVPGTVHHLVPSWVALGVLALSVWLSLPRLRSLTGRIIAVVDRGARLMITGVAGAFVIAVVLVWAIVGLAGLVAAISNGGAQYWIAEAIWIGFPILVMSARNDPMLGVRAPADTSQRAPEQPDYWGWDPTAGRYVSGQPGPSTSQTNDRMF